MTAALPNFRRVPQSTATEWSGEEPDPPFRRALLAIAEYKTLSQESKYWWVMAAAVVVTLLCELVPRPYSLYLHLVLAALTLVLAMRAAYRAARAFRLANKINDDAEKAAKFGVLNEEQPSPAEG